MEISKPPSPWTWRGASSLTKPAHAGRLLLPLHSHGIQRTARGGGNPKRTRPALPGGPLCCCRCLLIGHPDTHPTANEQRPPWSASSINPEPSRLVTPRWNACAMGIIKRNLDEAKQVICFFGCHMLIQTISCMTPPDLHIARVVQATAACHAIHAPPSHGH